MSNGSGGPHGTKLKYENTRYSALEEDSFVKVGIIVGSELIVTVIDRKTGKVLSTAPEPLGALD